MVYKGGYVRLELVDVDFVRDECESYENPDYFVSGSVGVIWVKKTKWNKLAK
jgi:hypothetical protein